MTSRLIIMMGLLVCAVAIASASAGPGSKRHPPGGHHGFIKPAPSQPIVLRNVTGRTLRALQITKDRSIELYDCRDITIVSCDVRSIGVFNCNDVRIQHCYLHDSGLNGVEIEYSHNVRIQGNRIERVSSGVYALESTAIAVVGNYVQDVQGPIPRGQMVQFNQVTGPGNIVSDNYARNFRGASTPEDVVSMFMSHGTEKSPILITRNYILGDPKLGSTDKSNTGSGIMLGDSGGSHITCSRNVIINPGAAGIGVAGGGDMMIEHNTVIGTRSNISNVGIYVWNQHHKPGGSVVVRNNDVTWRNLDNIRTSYWHGGGFESVIVKDNHFDNDRLLAQLPLPPSPPPWPPRPVGRNPVYPWR